MSKFVRMAALAVLFSTGHASAEALEYKREVRHLKATILNLKGLPQDLDSTVSALSARIEDLTSNRSDLTVHQEDNVVRVSMTGDVLFDFDKADIRTAAEPTLKEIARLIASIPVGETVIEGHTDSRGSDGYNQALSLRRAKAVATWLVAHGVDRKKLSVVGLGSSRPVAPNESDSGSDNPAGRALNRRVEFVLPRTQ
jgi:outer membrane protein OmpA-like peptidoglycan-associated protein